MAHTLYQLVSRRVSVLGRRFIVLAGKEAPSRNIGHRSNQERAPMRAMSESIGFS